jgi:hypothetical protein
VSAVLFLQFGIALYTSPVEAGLDRTYGRDPDSLLPLFGPKYEAALSSKELTMVDEVLTSLGYLKPHPNISSRTVDQIQILPLRPAMTPRWWMAYSSLRKLILPLRPLSQCLAPDILCGTTARNLMENCTQWSASDFRRDEEICAQPSPENSNYGSHYGECKMLCLCRWGCVSLRVRLE